LSNEIALAVTSDALYCAMTVRFVLLVAAYLLVCVCFLAGVEEVPWLRSSGRGMSRQANGAEPPRTQRMSGMA
jgi:hypothetical protein